MFNNQDWYRSQCMRKVTICHFWTVWIQISLFFNSIKKFAFIYRDSSNVCLYVLKNICYWFVLCEKGLKRLLQRWGKPFTLVRGLKSWKQNLKLMIYVATLWCFHCRNEVQDFILQCPQGMQLLCMHRDGAGVVSLHCHKTCLIRSCPFFLSLLKQIEDFMKTFFRGKRRMHFNLLMRILLFSYVIIRLFIKCSPFCYNVFHTICKNKQK